LRKADKDLTEHGDTKDPALCFRSSISNPITQEEKSRGDYDGRLGASLIEGEYDDPNQDMVNRATLLIA
jgi:hypothetical protein